MTIIEGMVFLMFVIYPVAMVGIYMSKKTGDLRYGDNQLQYWTGNSWICLDSEYRKEKIPLCLEQRLGILECKASKRHDYIQLVDGGGDIFVFKCPYCGSHSEINERNLTKTQRETIKKRFPNYKFKKGK